MASERYRETYHTDGGRRVLCRPPADLSINGQSLVGSPDKTGAYSILRQIAGNRVRQFNIGKAWQTHGIIKSVNEHSEVTVEQIALECPLKTQLPFILTLVGLNAGCPQVILEIDVVG